MNKYEVVKEELGRGSYGRIQLIKHIETGKLYVWKKVHYGNMSDKEKEHLISEVQILHSLKHENIVRYKEHFNEKACKTIFIVMEYCSEGDLGIKVQESMKKKRNFHEDLIWALIMQIVKALYECHGPDKEEQDPAKRRQKIIHRDLKPQNILLGHNSTVKLADFGISKTLKGDETHGMTSVGSPLYQSPEQIKGEKYDEKTDIWSLGVIMYEMASLRPPFTGQTPYALST
jgi:NIMA (never in mitosis gene a)-related kinase